MRLVLLFFISSLIINPVYAAEEQAKYITKDTPAPFTGYIITPEKAQKIYEMNIDLSLANKTNEIITKQNELLTQHLDKANQEINRLDESLVKAQDNSIWGKVGFFLVGAGITGLIGYGIYKTR